KPTIYKLLGIDEIDDFRGKELINFHGKKDDQVRIKYCCSARVLVVLLPAALNSIFEQWGISALPTWNISGKPCSGVAVDANKKIDDSDMNPAIKCQCTTSNGATTCRITELRVYALNVVGTIPDALANLTRLTNLNLGQNYLTGPLPSFIGDMTNMQYLSLGINALSGSIPKELGQLQNIISLSFSSNQFNGSLPPELGNLVTLQKLWASDNEFNGTIPDFIGNWTKLQVLRFQGNNFDGPIPESLSDLTSLTNLRISDIKTLPWPGQVIYLKLSNYRKVAISLVPQESNVWVALAEICHIINYLEAFLHGLEKAYNSKLFMFAVKCGGRAMTSAGGTFFESDNETLGAATYYVTNETRWAVNNVGRFAENSNSSYIASSSSQFTNTLDSELFQTTRLSPSSLRYYGLSLENGQYTITMQFTEFVIDDSTTWQSLGRRVFDVYSQGILQLEDFNIKREAGGVSNRAVVRTFKVNVTENVLEIHLFWAGKGTCCIPFQGTYGPSVSAISVTPDFTPTVSDKPPSTSSKKDRTGLIVGIVVGVSALCITSIFAFFMWRLRRRRIDEDEEFLSMTAKPNTFSYSELRNATDDFSPANKLGEGGFGSVYKGILSDGKVVAVKQLSVASRQGKSQFVTEIATISAVQHKNLVKLYGCCIEGDNRLLVYEFLENKSLDQALFGRDKLNLDWPTRYDICLGTARGLSYLHEESRLRIVHRDVKASNILLDAELVPKISDFGLAKLYDDKKTHMSTRVAGTIGYLAPEYAMRGHLTEKADVFAFGVVALEILSGRPNQDSSLDQEKIYLLEWAWNLHENDKELELIDPTLPEFNEAEVLRLIGVALLCIQASPSMRPPMSRVVAMLSGDIEVSSVTSRPGYLTDWQLDEINNFMTSDESREMAATSTTSTQHFTSSKSTTKSDQSPLASQPMLHEIIGDGR
ncbi:hypothetical protein ACLOJK_021371, partial [Asimina triloba]